LVLGICIHAPGSVVASSAANATNIREWNCPRVDSLGGHDISAAAVGGDGFAANLSTPRAAEIVHARWRKSTLSEASFTFPIGGSQLASLSVGPASPAGLWPSGSATATAAAGAGTGASAAVFAATAPPASGAAAAAGLGSPEATAAPDALDEAPMPTPTSPAELGTTPFCLDSSSSSVRYVNCQPIINAARQLSTPAVSNVASANSTGSVSVMSVTNLCAMQGQQPRR
jgi:hypothetical protein